MPPDLLSFLNKLPVDNNSYKLEFTGINIDNKYFQLKGKYPSIPFNKLLCLAILLQHLDINLFNEKEINALAALNIELIVSQNNNMRYRTLIKNGQLFDTKSSRLFKIIDTISISEVGMYSIISNYDNFNVNTFKEFIIDLCTKG